MLIYDVGDSIKNMCECLFLFSQFSRRYWHLWWGEWLERFLWRSGDVCRTGVCREHRKLPGREPGEWLRNARHYAFCLQVRRVVYSVLHFMLLFHPHTCLGYGSDQSETGESSSNHHRIISKPFLLFVSSGRQDPQHAADHFRGMSSRDQRSVL